MLTALNLASELHQLKAQVASRLDEIDREAASVAAMVEAALPADDEA
jgi:cell division protein ZapA (FtsZ GTPase activity inhibitor)